MANNTASEGELFHLPEYQELCGDDYELFEKKDKSGNLIASLSAASTGLRGVPLAIYLSNDQSALMELNKLLHLWHDKLIAKGVRRVNFLCNSKRMMKTAISAGYIFETDVRAAFYDGTKKQAKNEADLGDLILMPAEVRDLPAMERLWDETEGVNVEPWQKLLMPDYVRRNQSLVLNVFDETSLVASVIGAKTGIYGTINHLVVHPSYRGRGIGRRLLGECILQLQNFGAKAIFMTYRVTPERERFWINAGFEEREKIVLGNIVLG